VSFVIFVSFVYPSSLCAFAVLREIGLSLWPL
jgi:hypothetical protein